MADRLLDFAMQTGQGIVGAGLGLALQKGQDRRQIRQQQKLQNMQMEGQTKMQEQQYQNQLRLWKETNYGAQIEQLKAAGLNPGLIYGMGGGGGATAAAGTGPAVSGAHAPTGGGEAIAGAGITAQLGLMRAQKENIEADTENKKADIPVKTATKTKLDTETTGIQLSNDFLKQTMEDRIDIINSEMNQKIQDLNIAEGKTEEERRTREARVQTTIREAMQKQLENALIEQETKKSRTMTSAIKKGTELTQEQIALVKQKVTESEHLMKYWANQIALGWGKLDHEQIQDAAEALNMDKDILEQITEKIPQVIIGRFGPKGSTPNPVTGFHKR